MPLVEGIDLVKTFGAVRAVDHVSFAVEQGEFFGMLGPNGAGKTTTIRLLLDLYQPDSGAVRILGGPMTEAKKARIGYMPEERGLYQDLPLERVLLYLAALKGLPNAEARRRLEEALERFDLAAHRRKKVKELSKGMQQKAQIISAILHQPELLIIDEPFSGLDPLNTQMVKGVLLDLHRQGTTIMMSTHQMHQVEELCERILLVNHGQVMLYGPLEEIRRRFTGNALLVRAPGGLPDRLPGVLSVDRQNGSLRLALADGVSPQDILRNLVDQGIDLERFEVATPSLDEIFIWVVRDREAADAAAPADEGGVW